MADTHSIVTEEYIDVEVTGLQYIDCQLETNFTKSTFHDTRLQKCNFNKVLMAKSRWINCDFNGSTLTSYFTDARFENCNFEGATFRGLTGKFGGIRTKFLDCNLSGCTFNHVFLRACRFENCNLEGTRFIKCDLRGTTHNGTPILASD